MRLFSRLVIACGVSSTVVSAYAHLEFPMAMGLILMCLGVLLNHEDRISDIEKKVDE